MNNFASETSFVLMSAPRSGTTSLIRALGNHSECLCHREIFLRDNALNKKFRENHNLEELRKTPLKFVNAIFNFTDGKQCVGFKMWCNQNEEACDYLLSHEQVKKIILERENKLASFSSGLIRRQTGIANASSEEKKQLSLSNTSKLEFNQEKFIKYCKKRKQMFQKYNTDAKGDVLVIRYLDFSNPKTLNDVKKFLGLGCEDLSLPLIKINGSNIVERFQKGFHKQIESHLKDIDEESWAIEE